MKHSLAFIHPDAKLDPSVKVGPFVTIAGNVEIGEGTIIDPNVTIMEGVRIGKNCRISSGAVIGGLPQDLKFRGEDSLVIIGDSTTIRECVTINRGTLAKGKTVVGSNCLLMAYVHIAHDCILGDNIILGNATQVAGEVEIDDWAILGGGTLVHQFSKVGAHTMTQGGSKVNKDLPPFITAGREPLQFAGVNSIGLRRREYSNEKIGEIQEIYRILYQSGMNISNAIEQVEEEIPASEERDMIVEFVKNSPRGIVRGYFEK